MQGIVLYMDTRESCHRAGVVACGRRRLASIVVYRVGHVYLIYRDTPRLHSLATF